MALDRHILMMESEVHGEEIAARIWRQMGAASATEQREIGLVLLEAACAVAFAAGLQNGYRKGWDGACETWRSALSLSLDIRPDGH